MRGAFGRSGLAVVAIALGLGLASDGQAQEAVGRPAAKGRLVEIPGLVINLDQVQYLKLDAPGGDPGHLDVYFAGALISLDSEQTRQLLATIRKDQPAPLSKEPAAATPSRFVAFDGFDGKLALNWKPVRPDPTHVSLARNPGKLTITTQRGSIHGQQPTDDDGAPIPAKNLYLVDNPLAPDADFVLTTSVSDFTPDAPYQQAALIAYDDDDNYVKWSYEYDWRNNGGQTFIAVSEKAAEPTHSPIPGSEPGLKQFWLRLTRRGDRYELASSLDGKTYRVHGEATWADGAPKRLGILAKNGGMKDAAEVDAAFDFFELRSPAPERPAAEARND